LNVQVLLAAMSALEKVEQSPGEVPREEHEKHTSSKGLAVTFQDVAVKVHGIGEGCGSTCLSVVTDLMLSFGASKGSKRVSIILGILMACMAANFSDLNQHILKGVTGQVRLGEMVTVG
jgi:hypothetical protein